MLTTALLIGGAYLLFKKDKPGIGRVTQKELKAAGGYEYFQRVINFAGIILKQAPDTVLYIYDNIFHFVYNNGTGNAKINLKGAGERDFGKIEYYVLREYKGPVMYRDPTELVQMIQPLMPVKQIVSVKKVNRRREDLHRMFDEQINQIIEAKNYYQEY